MDFYAVLDQVVELLRQRGRVSYRALRRQFDLDDEGLEALKDELLYARYPVVDDAGQGLVWSGEAGPGQATSTALPPRASPVAEGERRRLTVMFCDLVDSTRLSGELDPEDLRDLLRAYQHTCAGVIERWGGHIAQYLGDGLLVYFGHPQAHEDDARRAVCAGLGILGAMRDLNARLYPRHGVRVAVRLGIHTGLVVVGEVGAGRHQEHLALGETPNIAARLQGLASPDSLVVGAATLRLIRQHFSYEDLGEHSLKGVAGRLHVYRIIAESGMQSPLDVRAPERLAPLVGREEERALLQRRWDEAATGLGQVVLITGEPGIGKSRLIQELREYVGAHHDARVEWRGSSYHQQSAFHPVIDHLHRVLQWQPDDSPEEKVRTLEAVVARSGLSPSEAVPLLAALLSLSTPHLPSTLPPQRQRQRTIETLVAWIDAQARRQPVLVIVEDLHWIDPSTLELLSLLIEKASGARLCLVMTSRPEFRPSWAMAAHLTMLTLRRFTRAQVERLATHVARDKGLPPSVIDEVVRRTDGVPLFVEELTRTVLDSGLLGERTDRYELLGSLASLGIPDTLHDALMARLDRLAPLKTVAQVGATIGRSFAYELVRVVAPMNIDLLHQALAQLVETELVAQRGAPPDATYSFKHALIQDAAYQSMLRTTRQHHHERIAKALVEQFPETAETQPELVAHHYTEAGLRVQAITYWQKAGERSSQRSAYVEAASQLTRALELLRTVPDAPERAQQELALQTLLGPVLNITKGQAAPEVERAYARVLELCGQVEEAPQLLPVLVGLWRFYYGRGTWRKAQELARQIVSLAHRLRVPDHLPQVHMVHGNTQLFSGEMEGACRALDEGTALYDPEQHRSQAFLYGYDPGVVCLSRGSWAFWMRGFPEQARQKHHRALALAEELGHRPSQVLAVCFGAMFHQFHGEGEAARAQAQAAVALATEQGFSHWVAWARIPLGWALVERGLGVEGIAHLEQGLATCRSLGAEINRHDLLGLLADAYAKTGQAEAGLATVAEAISAVHPADRFWEPELHRLQGTLLLAGGTADVAEAERCFHQALALARGQNARSLELRAATSLARLWQCRNRRAEARNLLSPIHAWFTEGSDTADLREARALLDELNED